MLELLLGESATSADDPVPAADNGTDPTRLSRSAGASYGHMNLGGGLSQNTLELFYSSPITDDGKTAARLMVPLVQNDVAGRNTHNLSDIGLSITNVVNLTPRYGIVVAGEVTFDTANQTEGGTGKNVFKATLAYVNFLPGGIIFAPTLGQSNSIWGQRSRADINMTVLDFYLVPKLGSSRFFVTLDPAINSNWELGTQYLSFAVTTGYSLGPAFGGSSQIYVRSSTYAGGERAANWGIEVGYKVLRF